MTDLKSTLPPDPLGVLRTYFKYISSDGRYYILAYFIKRLDGNDVAQWSRYCYDNDGQEEEEESKISREDDFHKMIESEGWEAAGHYTTVSK